MASAVTHVQSDTIIEQKEKIAAFAIVEFEYKVTKKMPITKNSTGTTHKIQHIASSRLQTMKPTKFYLPLPQESKCAVSPISPISLQSGRWSTGVQESTSLNDTDDNEIFNEVRDRSVLNNPELERQEAERECASSKKMVQKNIELQLTRNVTVVQESETIPKTSQSSFSVETPQQQSRGSCCIIM